jgi:hypothetical protein
MVQQTSLLRQTSEQEPRATEQYQRFLEASDRLGPHLEGLFRKGFLQIVSSSRDEQVGVHREQAVNQGGLMPPQHATPSNWQDTRLHFVEAMMVLLFNASDEKQQSSVEQAFARLSKQVENLEIWGVQPEAMRAYRDALSAVQKMLASNPEPGEIAVALGGDFAKRFRNT